MDNFYIACDLGSESGRVMLGSLHKGKLSVCEIRRFQNVPVQEKDSLQWDIPQLYRDTIEGLRGIGAHEEPVDSISCHSWAADYMLFAPDGSLITPTYHHRDPRAQAGMKNVLSKITAQALYDETGIQQNPSNTLFQLGAEKSKRLKGAHLMPVADGFNYLLAGVPRIEMSAASTMQLYNPIAKAWSDTLLNALKLPASLLPPVVLAGTELGALKPEIAKETGLENARVISSCSHDVAAALVGLPIAPGENWAYVRAGDTTLMGTQLVGPIISDESRDLNFTNELGFGGSVNFCKQTVGLWILDECKKFWKEKDRDLGDDMLMHLATSAPPFESLVDLSDPRFLTPGDMPLKIQAFCKESNQPIPRKLGPMLRCVLESLALLYRKTLTEMKNLTGRDFDRLYILNGSPNSLLNHFTANALQIPVVIPQIDTAVIGNLVVQAIALGHIKSLDVAREILSNSFKVETIIPHATLWDSAYTRLTSLVREEPPKG